MFLIPLLFVVVIFYFLREQGSYTFSRSTNILDERLAKGEITIEEYREIKQIQRKN